MRTIAEDDNNLPKSWIWMDENENVGRDQLRFNPLRIRITGKRVYT
jgi:hypothetical protein